jgi:hypothetical protein
LLHDHVAWADDARRGSDIEYRGLIEHLSNAWRRLWPEGLLIPDPDVPDRVLRFDQTDAVVLDLPGNFRPATPLTVEQRQKLVQVPREFEPFNRRPPKEIWRESSVDAALVSRWLSGLAGFMAGYDFDRLKSHLLTRRPDDPGRLTAAINALVDATNAGHSDVFAALPFSRVRILSALYDELDMPEVAWCCLDATGLPPAQIGDPLGSSAD